MTPDFQSSLHSSQPEDVAEALRTRQLDADDLRAALANAFDRIAVLDNIKRAAASPSAEPRLAYESKLREAIETVESGLDAMGEDMAAEGKARLVARVYQKMVDRARGDVNHPDQAVEAVDEPRLRSAIRLLHMAQDLADVDLSLEDTADALIDLYGWLGKHGDTPPPDDVADHRQEK